MVTLNRIYTRTGDAGKTRLATGQPVSKADLRVDAMLGRIQNELFDLGADLAMPAKEGEAEGSKLRILDSQVARLEAEIDDLNDRLPALKSFILPGGTPAAAALHLARTVSRRAEREAVRLVEAGEPVSGPAMRYLNRLSDHLFVAARWANDGGKAEVFWQSGATR